MLHGNWNLLKWQFFAAMFVIVWSAVATFILLKLVGLFVPLRMSDENLEIGDTAEHGHEVYPSDVPSLGYPNGIPGIASRGRPIGPSSGLGQSNTGRAIHRPGSGSPLSGRSLEPAWRGMRSTQRPARRRRVPEDRADGGAQPRTSSAAARSVAASPPTSSVVTIDSRQASRSWRILSLGPISVSCSISASGPRPPPDPCARPGTAPGSGHLLPRSPCGWPRWRGSWSPGPHAAEVQGVHGPQRVGCRLDVIGDDQRHRGGHLEVLAGPARLRTREAVGQRLAVEVVVVRRVEQRQPAVAQLGRHRDVLGSLCGQVDRDVGAQRVDARLQRLAQAGSARPAVSGNG